ncbi:MAG: hypothetical protein U5O15_10175 [Candidatus Krumholzibacteriota bacterium]|nr:hypothetical protein [Candidatus Krumholzibacteriota bacterium]
MKGTGLFKDFISFAASSVFINRCLVCERPVNQEDHSFYLPGPIPRGWPRETLSFFQNQFIFKTIGGICLSAGVLCDDCWLKLIPAAEYPVAAIDDIPIIAPFRTCEILLKIIRYLKFSGGKSAAEPLSWWMANALKNYFHDVADSALTELLVVPVPLHKSRRRRRGYNQASLLASRVSADLRCSFRTDLLVRVKNTKSQSRLNASSRKENVRGAFYMTDRVERGSVDLVLVDDLVTTGETVRECVKVLRRNGVSAVSVLSAGASKACFK